MQERIMALPEGSTIRADIHTHTLYSDGVHSPEALVKKAAGAGIGILAVTDHDSMEAYEETIEAGKTHGVLILSGVELSATLGSKDVHILGYNVDPFHAGFRQRLAFFRQERQRRAEKIVHKLNTLDVPLTLDHVLEQAGQAPLSRPHVAKAMKAAGFTRTYMQAFREYIADGGPAYVARYYVTPRDIIELIAEAGGVSILAHPSNYFTENELKTLIQAGLDGIETVHPSHDRERRQFFEGIASAYFLLQGGGSDYHGGEREDDVHFGTFTISTEMVKAIVLRSTLQQQ